MKKIIYGIGVLAAVALTLLPGSPAGANVTPQGFKACTGTNLDGWYVNDDEAALVPEPTSGGLKFDGQDLIHHRTSPIDLADMDKVSGTFTATVAGKVVFKAEADAPYSNIITTPEGKFWSTAMAYDQEGGQGHPVAKYSDLVGKPTKPGKAPFTSATHVVTFGVGYWTPEGSTVVTSITFHGRKYDLVCHPKPSPSHSSASPTASHSQGTGATPTGTSTSAAGLPVTGPNAAVYAGIGVAILGAGTGLVLLGRKRRARFEA